MVGVPSSKLCFGCLERRKKCDGRRPGCGQCAMRGLSCPGYRARFRLVSHNGAKLPYLAVDEASEGWKADGAIKVAEPNDLQLLPRNLYGTAKGIELLCRFEDIYKPRRRSTWQPLSTDLSDLPSWEWVLTVFQSSQIEPLLNDIVRALVLSSVGRCDKNTLYLQKGSALHAEALKTLKERLQGERNCCSDYILAAVMVFGMYEIQIGSEIRGNAWLTHVQGFETLLQLRARSDKPIPMWVKKLVWASQYNRWVVTMRARGRPGTAPAPILFDILENSAPADVKLFAILHRIAPVIAKVDQFEGMPHLCCEHQKARILQSLLSEIYDLEAELYTWPSTLSYTALLHWDEQSDVYSACSRLICISEVFERAICFPNVRIAIAMLLCWTGLLFVNVMKDMLDVSSSIANSVASPDISDTNDSPNPSNTSPERTGGSDTSYSLAVRIARSMEYFLHPDFGHLGTYLIGFPLSSSRAYFEQREMHKELLWLKVIDTRMTETGSGLGDFLRDLKSKSLAFGVFRDDTANDANEWRNT